MAETSYVAQDLFKQLERKTSARRPATAGARPQRTLGDTSINDISSSSPSLKGSAQILASLGIESTPIPRRGPFTEEKEATPIAKDAAIAQSSPVLGASELQALQRAFDQQERLLIGYQRENERCMLELEKMKVKQRACETHLLRLHGEDWEAEVARSVNGSPLRTSPRLSTEAPKPQSLPAGLDASTLLRHIDGVQALVQSLETRLRTREAELDALLAEREK